MHAEPCLLPNMLVIRVEAADPHHHCSPDQQVARLPAILFSQDSPSLLLVVISSEPPWTRTTFFFDTVDALLWAALWRSSRVAVQIENCWVGKDQLLYQGAEPML
jgi:hypothetical protein